MALGPVLGWTFVGVGAVAGVAAALVARRSVRLWLMPTVLVVPGLPFLLAGLFVLR